MPDEPKPISLKDELSKMARGAMPAAWLCDAYTEIESWRTTMAHADRMALAVKLDQHAGSETLHLVARDSWGAVKPFASYRVSQNSLKFYGQMDFNAPEVFQPITLSDEQAFIAHLLKVLRFALGLGA